MKNWVKNLENVDFQNLPNIYSQSYQDSLIEELFRNIGTQNSIPYCVDFGFNSNSLVIGTGANVANLLINKHWEGLLLDGEHENPDINLRKHFLTTENICNIFEQYNVPQTPEYISIDVDSIDLWLFEKLLENYRAMVFSVEYNCIFPLKTAITFPNVTNEHWEGDRGYGASLKALTILANNHGYSLIWVVPFLDAFFIRNDLIDDQSAQLVFSMSKWEPFTNKIIHTPLINEERLKMFVDYQKFVDTNGDVKTSQQNAFLDSKAFLTDSMDLKSLRRRGFRRSFRNIRERIRSKM